MSCCCNRVFNICESHDACIDGELILSDYFIAETTGIYRLIAEFLGVKFILEKEIESGADISFPVNRLNENYEYVTRLYDPNGVLMELSHEEVTYDCFKFKLQTKFKLTDEILPE